MAHTKKHSQPVPAGNRSQAGPPDATAQTGEAPSGAQGAPFQEQDEKRRLGNYQTEGEHSLQQPGGKKDANH